MLCQFDVGLGLAARGGVWIRECAARYERGVARIFEMWRIGEKLMLRVKCASRGIWISGKGRQTILVLDVRTCLGIELL